MKRKSQINLSLQGSMNASIERSKSRLILYIVGVIFIYGIIAFKVIKLTFFLEHEVKDGINYQLEATKNPDRLLIYDRNGILISTNLKTNSLFADTKNIAKPAEVARQIRTVLPDLNEAELIKKLSSKKSFVWIKRSLHPREMKKINDLGIPYLNFDIEKKRIYPHLNLFAHSLGMVGRDGQGLTGFEKFLDNLDEDSYEKLALNSRIDSSLDVRIQSAMHMELSKQMEKHKAIAASGLVMDVTNGEILALVSLPDYDPNTPQTLTSINQFNSVTLGTYEMGSTFKPITFAIALEKKLINLKTVVDATNPIKIGRFSISDFHPEKRPLTVPEVMMYSSNIGTAKIAEMIGGDAMQSYFRKLGFYDKVGVEINEKSKALMPRIWGDTTTLTASFGHGVAVTPLHVAAATAALVNGGVLNRPTLLKTLDGKTNKGTQIFSSSTSEKIRKLFRLVVEKGTGGKGEALGYFVGGKTGTAEKLVDGRYKSGTVIASFVGIFPMNKPKYLVMAIFDEPKPAPDTYGYATGGWVAAPVVSRVISAIGPIMKISPVDYQNPELVKRFTIDY